MDFNELLSALSLVVFTYDDSPITLLQLLQVPLYIFLAWFIITRVGRLIVKALKRRNVGADAIHLFTRMYFIISIAVLIFTCMEILNIPLTAFAFVSGAIAIGVGFGAQNIINNFISGWILMWERPIRIGDFLEVGEARGVVECINTRSTLIRRNDGVHMLVPNSLLLENTVTNWTLIDKNARTFVRVGVAYGSDVIKVRELIYQVIGERDDILPQPEPSVLFEDFGDNALIFDLIFWVSAVSETDIRRRRSEIRFRMYELFNEHNVVIAYPQRDLHVDGNLTINRSHKS
ncbi:MULTISPECIES: mechanosensitive ion channel family protein [Shewanella]|uniref:Mechanosensitive ion channel protein n=1 Tax=Shewanella psychromarinicola TaxID=2487742 RepID=A0A3N4E8P6_9GAMM|nr:MULTISPECIES: mechanosensitive ion channel domain-containing protein [Shewanella]AZG36606.1 mechanosensitive ion channel protein [Shewanella psychromarinicola]MCL1083230.1 mechanosensitive ion channel [Shewanella psychromarinicola]PKG77831.1 mechanosensitive ion channel protein [Shewanella sp. Actino-trap-3]RPA34453.1 mechanosensitive ion channel protein [Shewanella psychromarinicola]|tara:strand:+ start:36882 stop:37751 length:870 start_codon:yes stop_codon:yes gene_type:complete